MEKLNINFFLVGITSMPVRYASEVGVINLQTREQCTMAPPIKLPRTPVSNLDYTQS